MFSLVHTLVLNLLDSKYIHHRINNHMCCYWRSKPYQFNCKLHLKHSSTG